MPEFVPAAVMVLAILAPLLALCWIVEHYFHRRTVRQLREAQAAWKEENARCGRLEDDAVHRSGAHPPPIQAGHAPSR